MIRTFGLRLIGCVIIAGCSLPQGTAQSTGQPLPLQAGTLALSRIIFAADRPDQHCDPGVEEEVGRQLKYELIRRGFRVVEAGLPEAPKSFAADPVANWSGPQLVQYIPRQAAGLLFVRIEHYLQLDICGNRENGSHLELRGKLVIYGRPDGQNLWEASSSGSETGAKNMTFRVVSEFVNRAFDQFPYLNI